MASKRGQSVIVGLGLMANFPEANQRHFAFMLEGLAETVTTLHKRGIKVIVQRGQPDQVALSLAKETLKAHRNDERPHPIHGRANGTRRDS